MGRRAARSLALALLVACCLATPGAGACMTPAPLDKEGAIFGGYCDVNNPDFGELNRILYNRTNIEEVLVKQLATAQPVADELGGITSINSYPTNNATMYGKAIDLGIDLEVLRISEISQKTQTYKMHYILTWRWRDCRLLMNCMAISLNDRHSLFSSFWRPQVRISEREDDINSMLVQRHMFVGNGWDYYTEEHVSIFRCPFNFTDMPFDIQRCTLTLLLPEEPDFHIQLQWGDVEGEELTNAEWTLTQPKDWTRYHKLKEFVHPFGLANNSQLVAEFVLERQPAFMINNFIMQGLMFYLLSWVGMWIDVGAVPARAAVGVIPVLVTSNKMSALASSIPPISYETRLAGFMQLTLAMITLHMLEFGFVHYAARRYKVLSETFKQREQVLQDNADAEKSSGPSGLAKFEFKVVTCIHLYFETSMRVLSPLIYGVITGIILNS